MQRYREEHLGTILDIQIDTSHDCGEVFFEINDRVTHFEEKYSRFRPGNWLDTLNLSGRGTLDGDGIAMITYAQAVARETNGLFDITILPLLESIGYARAKEGSVSQNLGYKHIYQNGNVIELRNNVRIEFGAIGKGYLIDVLSDILKTKGFERFLVNFGGDMYAYGKWHIGIENPENAEYIIQELDLENEALAVSGGYARMFGETNNHLINPYTKQSPPHTKIAIVRAKKALHADVWATIECIK